MAGQAQSPKPKLKPKDQLASNRVSGTSATTAAAKSAAAPSKVRPADVPDSALGMAWLDRVTVGSDPAARLGLTVGELEPNMTAGWEDVNKKNTEMGKLIVDLRVNQLKETGEPTGDSMSLQAVGEHLQRNLAQLSSKSAEASATTGQAVASSLLAQSVPVRNGEKAEMWALLGELDAQLAELQLVNMSANGETQTNDKEATPPKRQTQVLLGSQLDDMDKHVSDLASRSKT